MKAHSLCPIPLLLLLWGIGFSSLTFGQDTISQDIIYLDSITVVPYLIEKRDWHHYDHDFGDDKYDHIMAAGKRGNINIRLKGGFYHIIQGGYLFRERFANRIRMEGGFTLSAISGYRWKLPFQTGIGIQVDRYSLSTLFPIFADVRGDIGTRKFAPYYNLMDGCAITFVPFYYLNGGYAFTHPKIWRGLWFSTEERYQGRWMLGVGMGLKMYTATKLRILISFGYQSQRFWRLLRENGGGDGWVRVGDITTHNLALRLGITL